MLGRVTSTSSSVLLRSKLNFYRHRLSFSSSAALLSKSSEQNSRGIRSRIQSIVKNDGDLSMRSMRMRYQNYNIQKAIRNLDGLRHSTIYDYNKVLISCVKQGKNRLAIKVFEKLRADKVVNCDSISYSTIITAYGNLRQVDKILDIYNEIFDTEIINTVILNAVINACVKTQQVDKANMILQQAIRSKLRLNANSFHPILGCYLKQVDKAKATLQKMQELHINPNVVTYNLMIEAYGSNDNLPQALSMFDEMKSHHLQPTITTYNSLIHACCKAKPKQLDKALLLLETMKQSHTSTPNESTFNSIIPPLCKYNSTQAISLFEEMKHSQLKPSRSTYMSIISALHETNQTEQAKELCEEMKQKYNMKATSPMYKGATAWLQSNELDPSLQSTIHSISISIR